MKCQLLLGTLALSGMSAATRMIEKVHEFQGMSQTMNERAQQAKATVAALKDSATQFRAAKRLVVERFAPRVAVITEDSVFYGNLFQAPLKNGNMQVKSANMGPHDILWVVDPNNVVYTLDTKSDGAAFTKVAENYRYVLPWQNGYFGLASKGHYHARGNIFFVPDATKPDQRVEILGSLLRIAYDGEVVCGEGLGHKCHCRKFDTTTFEEGPEPWTHHDVNGISCHPASEARYMSLAGNDFFVQPTAGGDWVHPQPGAKYKQIAVNGDFLVGIGLDNNLWFGEMDNGDTMFTSPSYDPSWVQGISNPKHVEVYCTPMPDF